MTNPGFDPEQAPAYLRGDIEPAQIPDEAAFALEGIGLGGDKDNPLDGTTLDSRINADIFSPKLNEVDIDELVELLREDVRRGLSKEQCRLLYDIDPPKTENGFNSEIEEVARKTKMWRLSRSSFARADLAQAFGLQESQVALYREEWMTNQGKIAYLHDNLDLWALRSIEDIVLPSAIGGGLDLSSLEGAEGLRLPDYIGGDLLISSLKIVKDSLVLPAYVGRCIELNSLMTANNLVTPKCFKSEEISLKGLRSSNNLSEIIGNYEGSVILPCALKSSVSKMNINPKLKIYWED